MGAPMNGWQRVAVVVSVVWLIAATAYDQWDKDAGKMRALGYASSICNNRTIEPISRFQRCSSASDAYENYDQHHTPFWSFMSALKFLVLGWAAAAVAFATYRWIIRGFRKHA